MRKPSYLPYRKRRERQKRILFSFLACAFLGAAAFVIYIAFAPRGGTPNTVSLDLQSSARPPSSTSSSESSDFSVSMSSAPSSVLVSTPPVSKQAIPKEGIYDYSADVPESEVVEDSYFDDAVFIGNSRLQGFILYAGLSKPRAYVDKGLAVDSALNKELFAIGGEKQTAMEALASDPNFKKVYLMFGINELGWVHGDAFVKKYTEIIDRIREIQPEAEIYVHSVLPVSAKKSAGDKIYNNEKILEYNTLLKAMVAEKKVFFVNVAEAVADESGVLPEEASADGVHLKKSYCEKWLAYLKSHTYENWVPDVNLYVEVSGEESSAGSQEIISSEVSPTDGKSVEISLKDE